VFGERERARAPLKKQVSGKFMVEEDKLHENLSRKSLYGLAKKECHQFCTGKT